MQVNVKELTGRITCLSLVFMIVLVLQSFLAVSFQVFQVSLVYSSVLCQLFQAPSISKFPSSYKYSTSVIDDFEPLVRLPT